MFNDKNVVAVQESEYPNSKSTATFLEHIISWWNIVNVKRCFKGQSLRNVRCNPVTCTSTDDNVLF